MIGGAQGAWGSFSDTGDMRPPISTTKATQRNLCEIPLCLVRSSRPLNPKTLKMSAYTAHCPPTARPQRSCQHRGTAHTRVRPRGRGAGKTSCPLPQSVGSPPTCKGKAKQSGYFASLDRFPAPLRIVLLLSRRWRGSGRRSRATPLTLGADPTPRHGVRWLGFNRLPLRRLSEAGVGAKPKVLAQKGLNVL